MWPSQTYISARGSGAAVNVYLLWEAYGEKEAKIKGDFLSKLAGFGHAQAHSADIFVPQDGAEDFVAGELRSVYEARWWDLQDHLPAFLIIDKPLKLFDPSKEVGVLLEIPKGILNGSVDPNSFFSRLQSSINQVSLAASEHKNGVGFLRRAYDSLEIKPQFFGVSADLKKMAIEPFIKAMLRPKKKR